MHWNSWFTTIGHYNVILLEKRVDCDDEDVLKYVWKSWTEHSDLFSTTNKSYSFQFWLQSPTLSMEKIRLFICGLTNLTHIPANMLTEDIKKNWKSLYILTQIIHGYISSLENDRTNSNISVVMWECMHFA